MTRGNPFRLVLKFARPPLFFGNLLQQFYNLADTAIAGHVLGRSRTRTDWSSFGAIWTYHEFCIWNEQWTGVVFKPRALEQGMSKNEACLLLDGNNFHVGIHCINVHFSVV